MGKISPGYLSTYSKRVSMLNKLIFTTAFFMLTQLANAQSTAFRKKLYTVPEVKEWAEKNQPYPTWHGWLLYQGSDTSIHHFISRVMDEWIYFNIKRTDLIIKDER